MPHFSDAKGFRQGSLFSHELHWMRNTPFVNLDAANFHGNDLCQLAEKSVLDINKYDHYVAELLYINNDPGAGYANAFVSHHQGELAAETLATVDVYQRRLLTSAASDKASQMISKSTSSRA